MQHMVVTLVSMLRWLEDLQDSTCVLLAGLPGSRKELKAFDWLPRSVTQIDFGKAGKYRHLLAVCLTKGQVYL